VTKKRYVYDYPLPANTVDMVIFTIRRARLNVLLIRRADEPFKDCWALPGGFVEVGVGHAPEGDQGESLDDAAARELQEETSLERERDGIFFEQLYTFGDPGRDPRGRVVSIAYYALVGMDAAPRVRPSSDATDAKWFGIGPAVLGEERSSGENEPLPDMAFDHAKILDMALERIRGKIDYDPRIARGLLPEEFTQKEFRRVHEVVKGTPYDQSNFSKRFRRMLEDGRFVETDEVKESRESGRPSRLYRFPE
jgi:8-oxo-dGTP diphosphatase